MILMIPNVYQGPEGRRAAAAFNTDIDTVEAMMQYNNRLEQAGALIASDGLAPPAGATRVSFSKGKTTLSDGPLSDSNGVLGGYWMIRVNSKNEAIEWAKQIPAHDGDVVEVRQVLEVSDFPAEVQGAAAETLLRVARTV